MIGQYLTELTYRKRKRSALPTETKKGLSKKKKTNKTKLANKSIATPEHGAITMEDIKRWKRKATKW